MLLDNKQIFIVEDSLQNRAVFSILLQKNGAQVHFERAGEGAIRQLKSLESVDVIIVDLMLADGVTGYDIFDKIRALPEYATVPIVAVSGADPNEAVSKTRAKGFAGFIAKPIDLSLFPTQIFDIINGQQVWP